MLSLGLTIFGLVLLTEVVSWIGKTVLLNFCYELHQCLFNRTAATRHKQLKKDIFVAKQELLQTSAQDQFARWAKLRRKVDKGLEDLDRLNSAQSASKASYTLKFTTALWTLTSGAQLAVGWWYGRHAVFYLPPQWFGPAAWWLALPFAPAGSVSCGVWQMACTRVLRVCARIVRDFAFPEKNVDLDGAGAGAENGAESAAKEKAEAGAAGTEE